MAFSLQFMAWQWPQRKGSSDTMHYWDIIVPDTVGLFVHKTAKHFTYFCVQNQQHNQHCKKERPFKSKQFMNVYCIFVCNNVLGWRLLNIFALPFPSLNVWWRPIYQSLLFWGNIAGFINFTTTKCSLCSASILQYRLLSSGPIYTQGYLSTCQEPIQNCLFKLISFLFH